MQGPFLIQIINQMTEKEREEYFKEINDSLDNEKKRPKVYTITAKEMIEDYNSKHKAK